MRMLSLAAFAILALVIRDHEEDVMTLLIAAASALAALSAILATICLKEAAKEIGTHLGNWISDIFSRPRTSPLPLNQLGPERRRRYLPPRQRRAAVGVDAAIERVHAWGQIDHVPCSLLTCAFRCSVGGWDGATRDLDEEIPEPGPMRLYFSNCALERARHASAGREASRR